MTAWPTETIDRIATTDDLHIAPYRADGATTGTLTWIWSVVGDGRLFVRAWNGLHGRWYRAAIAQRAGTITAARLTTIDTTREVPPWHEPRKRPSTCSTTTSVRWRSRTTAASAPSTPRT